MELKELSHLLKTAVEAGAEKALASAGRSQDQLSKAEAYRRYGRFNVDRWISEGLVVPTAASPHHSKKMLDLKKLGSVAESSNRVTYLPVADR